MPLESGLTLNVRARPLGAVSDTAVPLVAVPVLRAGGGVGKDAVGHGGQGGDTPPSTPVLPPLPPDLSAVARRAAERVRSAEGARVFGFAGETGAAQVVFIGLGCTPDDLDAEALRRFAGRAVRAAEELRLERVAVVVPEGFEGFGTADAARSLAEGLVLAAWRFRELKTGAGEKEAPLPLTSAEILVGRESGAEAGTDADTGAADAPGTSAVDDAVLEAVRVGVIVAEAENLARVLQSRPGNVATPTHLAAEAERLAAEYGLGVDVLGPERLREEHMHALLTVSQGSEQEPRLIVLRHAGGENGQRPLVLVGKGLTFDAGGISIKPSSGMEEMKYDMSGGAAVLGAMAAIARLEIPLNVVGIVPSSENLLSGRAMKPGDVITTRNRRTVEVVNTDAEGRLILCDALDYALELDPEAMVDCATLTGAVTIALGHHAMAVLGNDDGVIEELRAAGERTGERAWPLPLWKDYRRQLDSVSADLMNVGGRPAGTITAAIFLSEFVGEVPWGHLDIAGTAYGDGGDVPYRRKGGYGVPTRLLVEWVRSRVPG